MRFSIIIHTRGRVKLLEANLQNIKDMTINKDDIEVAVAYDLDDEDTAKEVPRWESEFKGIHTHFHGRVRSRNMNRDYINWLVRCHSSGEFVWAVNDDVLFRTPGWEGIAYNKIQGYLEDKPDKVVYCLTNDGGAKYGGLGYTAFPMLSRQAIEAYGGFFIDLFPGWHADCACYNVFKSVDRVLDLTEIMAEHLTYVLGKREKDDINKGMEAISNANYMGWHGRYDVYSTGMVREYINPGRGNAINWTLIIHTRDRIELLTKLLDSIQRTTHEPRNLEVIVLYDIDDTAMHRAAPRLGVQYSNINAKFCDRERSAMMNRDYINYAVKLWANGKYIFCLNDDVEFKTDSWDTIAWDKLQVYLKDKPDGIVYAITDDRTPGKPAGGHFTCFPIISQVATVIMGGFFDDEFPAWNADIAAHFVYSRINRVLDLREVIAAHISHHAGVRDKDVIDFRMADLTQTGPQDPSMFVQRDVDRLMEHINAFKP